MDKKRPSLFCIRGEGTSTTKEKEAPLCILVPTEGFSKYDDDEDFQTINGDDSGTDMEGLDQKRTEIVKLIESARLKASREQVRFPLPAKVYSRNR